MQNEKELLELVENCGGGSTWWLSDFYESFCALYGLDFNEIEANAFKIRYRLNRLFKKGLLCKMRGGTGHGGKSLFNSTSFTMWMPKRYENK
jgi:hypothetical protein